MWPPPRPRRSHPARHPARRHQAAMHPTHPLQLHVVPVQLHLLQLHLGRRNGLLQRGRVHALKLTRLRRRLQLAPLLPLLAFFALLAPHGRGNGAPVRRKPPRYSYIFRFCLSRSRPPMAKICDVPVDRIQLGCDQIVKYSPLVCDGGMRRGEPAAAPCSTRPAPAAEKLLSTRSARIWRPGSRSATAP